MEQTDQSTEKNSTAPLRNGILSKAGLILILVGALLLADFNLKTGWLALVILPLMGTMGLAASLAYRRPTWLIPGALAAGLGFGSFLALTSVMDLALYERLGAFFLAFGLSFGLITLLSHFLYNRITWWALIPFGILAAVGIVFLLTPVGLLDFVLYVPLGLGLAFLVWGWAQRLFGLIIPGCLLASIGPGIYFAWGMPGTEPNPLTQTGIMLVTFALGWGLITVLSRRITRKFVWWPLIPGGVMAMVGWGLYIGGNPGNAVSFIGNTGSIGLILFGIYLLLLRRGIHR